MALTNQLANYLVDCITGLRATTASTQHFYLGLGTALDVASEEMTELTGEKGKAEPGGRQFATDYARIEMSNMAQAGQAGLGQKITCNQSQLQFPINSGEDSEEDWPEVKYIGIYSGPEESMGSYLIAYGELASPVVVEHNQVALFKANDLRISVDLNPGDPVTCNFGSTDSSTEENRTDHYTSDAITIPAKATYCTVTDPSIVSASVDSTGKIIIRYPKYASNGTTSTAGTLRLGTTTVNAFDGSDLTKAHLLKTFKVSSLPYNVATKREVLVSSEFTAIDENTPNFGQVQYYHFSNTTVLADANDVSYTAGSGEGGTGGTFKVKPRAAGSCRISVFTVDPTQTLTAIPVAMYKINATV